jgi:hypothetical protein
MNSRGARGLIAVDKMGGKVLFLDPDSYATTHILDDFERLPHELLVAPQSSTAYVPIYGDGIHGRNPNPGHLLSVVDLETRRHVTDIDLSPYVAPHGLQIGPGGLASLVRTVAWSPLSISPRMQSSVRSKPVPSIRIAL